MKTKNISVLIGSGFSIPAGFPKVDEIGEFLINAGNIGVYYHTDQSFYHPCDSNKMSGEKYEYFLEKIVEHTHYCEINNIKKFNYEDFYDYITLDNNRDPLIQKCINELITHSLQKNITCIDHLKYQNFLFLLKELHLSQNNIKIHTLNHDILLEQLIENDYILQKNMSDGYTLSNNLYCTYQGEKVYIKVFENSFNSNINLFKLHGSIDENFITNEIRGKNIYDINHINRTDTGNYLELPVSNLVGTFLSGKTYKQRRYSEDYFSCLLSHFKRNLINSNILIVIGYGFGDSGINTILKNNFLKCPHKKIIIIDPNASKISIPANFCKKIIKINKGITDLSKEEIKFLILRELKI